MDQRERSADRRRFQKIAFVFAVGLATVLISIAVIVWVPSDDQARGRRAPFVGIPIGLVFMGASVIDLVKRLVSGPTEPGKRSRF